VWRVQDLQKLKPREFGMAEWMEILRELTRELQRGVEMRWEWWMAGGWLEVG